MILCDVWQLKSVSFLKRWIDSKDDHHHVLRPNYRYDAMRAYRQECTRRTHTMSCGWTNVHDMMRNESYIRTPRTSTSKPLHAPCSYKHWAAIASLLLGIFFGFIFFLVLPCISFSSLCLSHDYHFFIISLNMFELSQPPVHTEQFERDTVVPVLGINLLMSSGSSWIGAYRHLCAQHCMSVGHQSNLMQFVSKKMQGFHKWGTSKSGL